MLKQKAKYKNLFNEFEPVSSATWEEQILKDIKGADYNTKLRWKTSDGYVTEPFYTRDDEKSKFYVGKSFGNVSDLKKGGVDGNDWKIRQDVFITDLGKANLQIKELGKKGVDTIGIPLNSHQVKSRQDVETLFNGVSFNDLSFHVHLAKRAGEHFTYLINFLTERQLTDVFHGSISFDPLNHLIRSGSFYDDENMDFKQLSNLVQISQKTLPECKIIGINGSDIGNSGATISQELALALSMAVEYLDKLTEAGFTIDQLSGLMHLTLSTGTQYFPEIAKIRATRILWSVILEQYGLTDANAPVFIHTVTQRYTQTLYDPHVNILRSATSAMAAIIGGADSLRVLPFDDIMTRNNEFSARIARNVQIILKEEACLNKVSDPAAGSGYIEKHTMALVEEAWKIFMVIEKEGGFLKAFKKGVIQEMIEKSDMERRSHLFQRKEVLLGTNQYPRYNETLKPSIEKEGKTCHMPNAMVAKPLKERRLAADFEKVRIKTENQVKKPSVFLFRIGDVVMQKARAGFSSGFFACGGFDIMEEQEIESIDAGLDIVQKINPDIIVLCSSDKDYATLVPEIFTKKNDSRIWVIAGAPEGMDGLKEIGVQHFIHLKSNVLHELEKFQNLLNIH